MEKKDIKSQLKSQREFNYDLIHYNGKGDKGIIYDDTYTEAQIEQATRLVQHINAYTDMLSQIISENRVFDWGYFEDKMNK